MIRLTQLAVSKRSVTVLITLAALLAGVFSWSQLKQELLPDIQFPYVVVDHARCRERALRTLPRR